MFVANSDFENHFLSALGAPGDRHYRAIQLSGRLTWFIVTCALQDDGLEMLHSVCCAWDEDLLALLEPRPHSRAVSLQRVVSSHEGDGRWEAREVSKVWCIASQKGKQVLVFQDRDGSESSGPFGAPVVDDLGERELVYEAMRVAPDEPQPQREPPAKNY